VSFSVFKDLVEQTEEQRRNFFKLTFGSATGYICVCYLPHTDSKHKKMRKVFFEYPKDLEEMLENISAHSEQLVHAYFCPSLYGKPGDKHKEFISTCTNIWADLDECDPRNMLVTPSLITQTSPGRYQALWLLEDPVEPRLAEEIAMKIAYYHADQGADKSGWDLSQLLRIPYTPNFKYGDPTEAPLVTILHAERKLYRVSDFDRYPLVPAIQKYVNQPIPKAVRYEDQETPVELMNRFGLWEHEYLWSEEPEEDWSSPLWKLVNICVEANMSPTEAFIICDSAACNKYRRDDRPEDDLWHDINKCFMKKNEVTKIAPTISATIPDLLTSEEVKIVQGRTTFIERYIEWASSLTDAATQYHQSGAFIILTSILSGNIKLFTNFGAIIPNLWFMILGNPTLTRKTTAMNLAMKLLYEVDERALLATDGSLEGILVGMRDRPRQPSIFLRDEFTGLLEAIAHKEYMAGFAEQLTKLYDGEPLRRLLRKETIDIRDPIFIMYVGGIKSKTQMMITEELVMGGFLPRFVIVTAEPDPSKVRDIGPPQEKDYEVRDSLKNELMDLHNHYVQSQDVDIVKDGLKVGTERKTYEAILTRDAWKRYNEYERTLTQTAMDAGLDYLTPVYDRLAKSTLKAAILIAASMQRSNEIVVGIDDLLHAIYYARGWRAYSSEIVNGIGKTYDERIIDKMYQAVVKSELGIGRGELMTMYHLDSKRADLLFKTMEQRKMMTLQDVDGERRYKTKG